MDATFLRPAPTTLLLMLDLPVLSFLLWRLILVGMLLLWWRSLPGFHLVAEAHTVLDQLPQDAHVLWKSTTLIATSRCPLWNARWYIVPDCLLARTPPFTAPTLAQRRSFYSATHCPALGRVPRHFISTIRYHIHIFVLCFVFEAC